MYALTVHIAPRGTPTVDTQSTMDPFGGTISGMTTSAQVVDLADISYGSSTTFSYAGNSSSGTLTVGDGTHTAHLALVGSYATANFSIYADGSGGTDVVDPPTGASSVTGDAGLDQLVQAIVSFSPTGANQAGLSVPPTSAYAPSIAENQRHT